MTMHDNAKLAGQLDPWTDEVTKRHDRFILAGSTVYILPFFVDMTAIDARP
jgi:hypothetical protein